MVSYAHLEIEILPQPLNCSEVTYPDLPTRENDVQCGRPAEHLCAYCCDGVCIRCSVTCYECGESLHDGCRDDHAKETGHDVNGTAHQGGPGRPSLPEYSQASELDADQYDAEFRKGQPALVELLDREIDRISNIVDGRL